MGPGQLWPGASSGRNSRAEAGAALRFLQARSAARRKNRQSAREPTLPAPGCGALLLLRASPRPRKKQTAVLLRLANFPSGRQCALVKIGALRQTQLPVSSAGRGRCVCPCSASAVSAAGSASAAQPTTSPCFVRRTRSLFVPLALSRFLRRAGDGACKNRSAAPNTAPCFVRRTRSLCLPFKQKPARRQEHPKTGCPAAGRKIQSMTQAYSSWRPSRARKMVWRSACSSLEPTGTPDARRVVRTPRGLRVRAR